MLARASGRLRLSYCGAKPSLQSTATPVRFGVAAEVVHQALDTILKKHILYKQTRPTRGCK
jgi:hypothetical protein